MAASKDSATVSLHKLEKPEDYAAWKQAALGALRKENCEAAVTTSYNAPNKLSVEAVLVAQGFHANDLTVPVVFTRLTHEIEKYNKAIAKAAGIIQDMVGPQWLYILQGQDSPQKMWKALSNRFEKLTPMDPVAVIHELSARQMLSPKDDIHEYCRAYQTGYDKIMSATIKDKSKITAKAAEAILQGFMLRNVAEAYAPLVSQI
jgi:hypothetical protein